MAPAEPRPRVVIVGGGFGGLAAARGLAGGPFEVTLVDRRNHHLFQPLLYQVATGALSPANIASPLRSLLKRARNVRVLLAEATDVVPAERRVVLADGELPYDVLIVAAGAETSYYGHDDWQRRAPGLKSIEDARAIRAQALAAFERAERATDEARRRSLLTFVVVGGGATGVELAGALAEVAYQTLVGEFRAIDPRTARIVLVEATDRLLGAFPEELATRAARDLERLGVEVRLGWQIAGVGDGEVTLAGSAGARETVSTPNVFWAAGVRSSPLGARLAAALGLPTDRAGRLAVEADCSLPGHPEIFVIGDLANYSHGLAQPLPGLAPVAMQQGRHVARVLADRRRGRATPPLRYRDKGTMATVGRRRAVAAIGRLHLTGAIAWLAWLFVHLLYIARFENRVLVLVQWAWNYVTRNRSARLITPGG